MAAFVIGAAQPQGPLGTVAHRHACADFDIYGSGGPAVALYVHGGSWTHGDRSTDAWFLDIGRQLQRRGWDVATTDYRFGVWPVQMDDVACTVNALHREYRTVVAWGFSAGGQMTALLAATGAVDRAVDLSGPVDMTTPPKAVESLFPVALRESASAALLHMPAKPLLVIAGDQDPIISVASLEASPFYRVIVAGGNHTLDALGMTPGRDELIDRAVSFLEQP